MISQTQVLKSLEIYGSPDSGDRFHIRSCAPLQGGRPTTSEGSYISQMRRPGRRSGRQNLCQHQVRSRLHRQKIASQCLFEDLQHGKTLAGKGCKTQQTSTVLSELGEHTMRASCSQTCIVHGGHRSQGARMLNSQKDIRIPRTGVDVL
jgi:hypothetical protein